MSTVKTLTVPVIGMTCANCVAAVERNAKKVTTVTEAAVNFASERLTINYDPAISKPQEVLTDVIARVERAGYSVPTESVELPLPGMTCANCANTIQRRLNKVEGVISAEVNYATERAAVQFVPGATSYSELVAAVRQAGYDVVESASTGETQDAEAAAREAEVRHQWTRLMVGVVFALPLFLLSMARDFNLVGAWAHEAWVNWLFLALATPVQFYVGWDYYVGAYKSLRNGQRQHGCVGSVGVVCGLRL